jgi:hypothetical protein
VCGICVGIAAHESATMLSSAFAADLAQFLKYPQQCVRGALATNGSLYQKSNHRVKHYKTKACKGCAVRHLCTTNKNGRFIERGIHQEELENKAKRVLENTDYHKLRQQVSEPQFGTLKRHWGFTYTLMKGKENVLSAVYLCFSVYHLIRTLNILGPKVLLASLKSLTNYLNRQIERFLDILCPLGSQISSTNFL